MAKVQQKGYRCGKCGKVLHGEEDMHGQCPRAEGGRSHIVSMAAMFDDRFWGLTSSKVPGR